MKRPPLLAGIVSVAVIAVVVLAFSTIGSPAEERARRFDQQRVMDLQSISGAIDQYYNGATQTLPGTIEALKKQPNIYLQASTDPETGVAYEYRTTGKDSYELCATFTSNSNANQDYGPKSIPVPVGNPPMTWSHGAEHTCFQLKANAWNVKP